MLNNYLILIVSCFTIFFILNYYSYKINLLDIPTARKLHKKPVPLIVGIVIGLSLIISVYLFDFKDPYFNIILSFSVIIVIVGVR